MVKVWGKTLRKNRIIQNYTAEIHEIFSEEAALNGIYLICVELDMPRPIVLKKHMRDIRDFLFVKFLPDDFIEKVNFDRFEVEIFIEKKNKSD